MQLEQGSRGWAQPPKTIWRHQSPPVNNLEGATLPLCLVRSADLATTNSRHCIITHRVWQLGFRIISTSPNVSPGPSTATLVR